MICAGLGGCLNPTRQAEDAGGWKMPSQLTPAGTERGGEPLVRAYVPGSGWVRGTQRAVDGIGRPLEGDTGPNRTLAACVTAVHSQAGPARAKSVEHAVLSPERKRKDGNYESTVLFRIVYPSFAGYDVREQALVCVTKADGSIVDAYPEG
jgi:hypothetical protein